MSNTQTKHPLQIKYDSVTNQQLTNYIITLEERIKNLETNHKKLLEILTHGK